MQRPLALAALTSLALVVGITPAGADDFGTEPPAAKRAEGRYFVELAEIMLTADQFTMAIGSLDDQGPGAGAAAKDVIGDLGKYSAEAPRVTIGLNRPNGTQLSFTVFDFDLASKQIPQNFEGTGDVFTPYLLPPGVVFQRQGSQANGEADDDYVPNWAVAHAFVRRLDYKQLDFTMARDLYQNKAVHLRWLSGLRYAQMQQGILTATAYAREFGVEPRGGIRIPTEAQDFAFLQSSTETHGTGPKVGLWGQVTPFKNKKWSFEGTADVAFLPGSTTASYGIRFLDDTTELRTITFTDGMGNVTRIQIRQPESPILPGVPVAAETSPFAALNRQTDFTEMTYHLSGQLGFRYQVRDFFTVGLDLWQMRWYNVLDQVGMLETVANGATYEFIPGQPEARDPALRNDENVLHVPRFTKREDYVIDGVSLNLSFQF